MSRVDAERRITGALRVSYESHGGGITPDRFATTTKRIYDALFAAEPRDTGPVREHLDEVRLDGKRVILRVGDYVEVGPSRPKKQDGWVGTIMDIFIDRGGYVVEVHHPTDRIRRCVPVARIRGRRRAPETRT